jgi:hypothetical protein
MTPSSQERLFQAGCLGVFLGVCVLVYLAVTSHWEYALAIVGLILVWGLIGRLRERHLRRMLLEALTAACADCGAAIPRLVEGSSYGWPTFGLVFVSASELKLAEESGCVAAFKQSVQSLHGHIGDKGNPFDADHAVWVTYEGHPYADLRT